MSSLIINITYEPLGVAAFAVGVLFFFLDDFRTVRLTGDQEDPVLVLDDENRVRDFNAEAERLFQALEIEASVEAYLPGFDAYVEGPESDAIFEMDGPNGPQYYRLGIQSFSTDRSRLGSSVTLTDVTEREEYRRELESQNDRVEQFAGMASHDLRNPLTVAKGRVAHLREREDNEHLQAVSRAHGRMDTLIDDVLTLAREGQPIDEREQVALSAVVAEAWESVATDAASLTVVRDGEFPADRTRLQQLLENLFRNAIEHGLPTDAAADADRLHIRVGILDGGDGFYVADDGVGVTENERESVLESGYSTAEEGTGLGLAIVTEIVAAHGWRVDVTDSADGGARFEIRGVAVEA